ncbi:Protein of unknown function [Pyronema omphalodes CBS 100304]|uniref:Uncharacterized protein n=1 Tax=Pyronema omphalodes (strain CBS 100304) TaxID=1076935 RepID=U4LW72_PYROM|nr:Protein of unknown function [Pyronema omphalodes CBS 100304]
MKSMFLTRAVVSCLRTVPHTFIRAASYSAFQNPSALPDSITLGLLLGRQYQVILGATATIHVPAPPSFQTTVPDIPDEILENMPHDSKIHDTIYNMRCAVLAMRWLIHEIESKGPIDASAQLEIDRTWAEMAEVKKRIDELLKIADELYSNRK